MCTWTIKHAKPRSCPSGTKIPRSKAFIRFSNVGCIHFCCSASSCVLHSIAQACITDCVGTGPKLSEAFGVFQGVALGMAFMIGESPPPLKFTHSCLPTRHREMMSTARYGVCVFFGVHLFVSAFVPPEGVPGKAGWVATHPLSPCLSHVVISSTISYAHAVS